MRYDEADVERLLRAAWWDWPIGRVSEHARTIMAGDPAELDRIGRQIRASAAPASGERAP
jgi:virginiamycin A acetyltransferase